MKCFHLNFGGVSFVKLVKADICYAIGAQWW